MARVYVGRKLVERQSDSKTKGYVYFMQAVPDGLIKIGWSASHPDARLKRIRATSPVPIAPLAMMEGGLAAEAAMHARFLALWSHGEWFSPTPELTEHIKSVAKPWPDPETKRRRPATDEANLDLVLSAEERELARWAKRTKCEHDGMTKTLFEWSEHLAIPLAQMGQWRDEGFRVDLIGGYQRLRLEEPPAFACVRF